MCYDAWHRVYSRVHAWEGSYTVAGLSLTFWPNPVYRNHPGGLQLEDAGLMIAKKTLEPLVAGTE